MNHLVVFCIGLQQQGFILLCDRCERDAEKEYFFSSSAPCQTKNDAMVDEAKK